MVVGKERGDWICLCFGWPVRAEQRAGPTGNTQENDIKYSNEKY
jgi:hypothetical protein